MSCMTQVLSIGEVSRRSGVAASALRFYEERGLIEPLEADERRRPYRLTAAGATKLDASLAGMRRILEAGTARLAAAT